MHIFLLCLAFFALIMTGMAVGVIFSNKELKGSCGGAGGECACEKAGRPKACEQLSKVEEALLRQQEQA